MVQFGWPALAIKGRARAWVCGLVWLAASGCGGRAIEGLIEREVTLVADDVRIREDQGSLRIRAVLDVEATRDIEVQLHVAGTATAGQDYAPTPSTLVVPEGARFVAFSLDLLDDELPEFAETVELTVSGQEDVRVPDDPLVITIADDDSSLGRSISIADATGSEQDGALEFTVELNGPSPAEVSVAYATVDGTAVAGSDYTAASGAVVFAPGETSHVISVAITDDDVAELAETFTVVLSAPVAAIIADDTGTGTITADGDVNGPDAPRVSVADLSVNEADGTALVTLSLTNPSALYVEVEFATADGTALAGIDYQPASGAATFAPGTTTQTIAIDLVDDTLGELDETFVVDLLVATNASIDDDQSDVTILADGGPGGADEPVVSIAGASALETAGAVTLAVTLSNPSVLPISVSFATANVTALEGLDYVAASGTIAFAAGETQQTVTVVLLDDTIAEPAELLDVILSNPVNASIGVGLAQVTIDTDGGHGGDTPQMVVSGATVDEGGGSVTLDVTLSSPSAFEISADFATADASAQAGLDYVATSGSLTFAPGETSKTITITILEETLGEPDETFTVGLSNAVNALLGGNGTVTISGNDVPALSVDDVSVLEDAGSITFTVSLSNPSSQDVSLTFATASGSATQDADFGGESGALDLTAGALSATVVVSIIDDNVSEGDETFFLDLANAANATIADGRGAATITGDDTTPGGGDTPVVSIAGATVSEADGTARFTVSLSNPSARDVQVTYASSDGSAVAPDDYAAASGVLTIPAGSTTEPIDVAVVDDSLAELDEEFYLGLSAPLYATLGATTQATALVLGDDNTPGGGDTPTIMVADASGSEASGVVQFTVQLSNASVQAITVDYATSAVTAVHDVDYVETSGTLTFAPGETQLPVSVTVYDDDLGELAETLLLALSNAANATIGSAPATGTIAANDTPSLTIADVTIDEADGSATVAVSLSNPSALTVTVGFATADGTAVAPDDYTSHGGTLSFAPNDLSKSVTVSVDDEVLGEPSESFSLNLSGATNATIGKAQGVITINASDVPSVSIAGSSVDEGAGQADFVLTLSNPSALPISVDYATGDSADTALPGASADYLATSGTASFAAGDTTVVVPVTINDDDLGEGAETFTMTLSSAVNATIDTASAVGTIAVSDTPTISISDAIVDEDGTPLSFEVTLSNASALTVTVSYATANNGASSPADYAAQSGTLTFFAGDTSKTIDIAVVDDAVSELDEALFVNLSAAVNATILDGQALGTIRGDTPGGGDTPTISIADTSVNEDGQLVFDVTLSNPSAFTVTAEWSTQDGTAVAPGDYTAVAGGVVTFDPGEQLQTIIVSLVDDTLGELAETVIVNLANPSNATILDGQATGTINANDAPSISIADVSVDESAGTATFSVSLSNASTQTVTVVYATAAGTAVAPSDFTAITGTSSFDPGVMTRSIVVTLVNDNVGEPAETFFVNLSAATNATIADDQGQGTIAVSDTPSVSIDDVAVEETAGALTFTLTLSNPASQAVTVDYTTTDDTAVSPGDYAQASGVATFAALATSTTVTVTIADDDRGEAAESFFLDLTGVSANATLAETRGVGTINVSDTPTLSIADASGTEASGSVSLAVTLSNASDLTVTVRASTANGTALAASDYTAIVNQLVTFDPGQLSKDVVVSITDDTLGEPNETFTVSLSSPTNATLLDASGTATIPANDAPSITIDDVTVSESAGTATLTLTLSNASSQTVTVSYATANDTATSGSDYTAKSGTVTFLANNTTQSVTIDILEDNLGEPDESLVVNLSGATNASIADTQGRITISANDTPTISVADVTVSESAGVVTFTVSLSNPSSLSVLLDYATSDGAAIAPDDYIAESGSIAFAANEVSKPIEITLVNDDLGELDEELYIDLSAAENASLPDTRAMATINANDTPSISIDDVSVAEADSPAVFTVSLSNPSSLSVSVTAATANNSAVAPGDYTSLTQALTFLPGDTTETLPVTIIDNTVPEANEIFFVNLSGASNATLADNQGQGTITNDDANPTVRFSVASQSASEATGTVTVQIALSAISDLSISVPFSVSASSTATSPADYAFDAASPTSPVVFSPGVTVRTLTLNLVSDGVTESDETVIIDLGTPSNATLGSPATHTLTVLDNDTPLLVTAAETMDADGDGRIDHYKLTFSRDVNDSTFPGYVLNGSGAAQSDWLVAGLFDVVLEHGTAAPAADTANDDVLYIGFTENAAHGTDATPDVTTTATPGLQATTGTPCSQIVSGTVAEADKAKPVLLSATTEAGLASLYVSFSEPVYVSGTCPGASVPATAFIYHDDSTSDVSGVVAGSDANGCDEKVVLAASSGTFTAADLYVDAIEADPAQLSDVAGNFAASGATTITGIIHPYVLNVVSSGPLSARITFSEPMNTTQAADASNYTYTTVPASCDAAAAVSAGVMIDATTFELTTSVQSNCTYKLEVTGDVRDLNEDAGVVSPKFGTFQGNAVLRVVSAEARSLRTALITFSKDVKATGTGGASNSSYFTVSSALGAVVSSQRYDAITGSVGDRNKVLVTHTNDQGALFYLAIASTSLRNEADTESLAAEPLDRASFQGLGGNVTSLDQGPLFTDPFADGTTFSFVFEHGGKIYAGPNDNNNAVFRFDPDGSNAVITSFLIDSGTTGAPFTSYGNSIARPSESVVSSGGVTRYYLTPGTDLSLYSPGVLVVVTGCANTANNHATALAATAVNDASDYVEVSATGVTSSSETCVVSLYNNAGPADFDGVDAFVSTTVNGTKYVVFGAHNYGGGGFNELYYSSDTDTVLDTSYCDISGVTIGNTESLQTIYGYGNYLYFGFASDKAFQPLFARLNLSTGACGALSDVVVSPNRQIRSLAYLGKNGTPANPATNIGIDAIIVAADGSSVPALYISNNGGIAATTDLPPTGATTWVDVRHDGDGVWTGTTQAIPHIGKLRPGEKGVPLMVQWGDYLFVARNRSDSGGIAEVWRYSLAAGLGGSPGPSDASRWELVFASTDAGMNPNDRDLSLIVVSGSRLYVGFDNDSDGAEVYRTVAGTTPAQADSFADFEQVGGSGLGPVGAPASMFAKNKHLISNVAVHYDGDDYLYVTVGCLSDLTDNGLCDRDDAVGATDFSIRMFRQVD